MSLSARATPEVVAGSSRLLVVGVELEQSVSAMPVRLHPRAAGQLRRLEEGGVVEADLRAVWAWASLSADPDAVWLREHGHVGWAVLSRPERWAHRLSQARAWEARGRTTEARPRGRAVPLATDEWAGAALAALAGAGEAIDITPDAGG